MVINLKSRCTVIVLSAFLALMLSTTTILAQEYSRVTFRCILRGAGIMRDLYGSGYPFAIEGSLRLVGVSEIEKPSWATWYRLLPGYKILGGATITWGENTIKVTLGPPIDLINTRLFGNGDIFISGLSFTGTFNGNPISGAGPSAIRLEESCPYAGGKPTVTLVLVFGGHYYHAQWVGDPIITLDVTLR